MRYEVGALSESQQASIPGGTGAANGNRTRASLPAVGDAPILREGCDPKIASPEDVTCHICNAGPGQACKVGRVQYHKPRLDNFAHVSHGPEPGEVVLVGPRRSTSLMGGRDKYRVLSVNALGVLLRKGRRMVGDLEIPRASFTDYNAVIGAWQVEATS